MAASRCCQGVSLLITAMLMFCEAHFQQNARQQGYYYQLQDAQIKKLAIVQGQGAIGHARDQHAQFVQEPSVMEESYYYQDAQNQQGPNVMGQGYYYQEAIQQQGPEAEQQSLSCLFQIKSPSKNTTICLQADRICTLNISVPACSSSASSCKMIGENNALIKKFVSLHPEVYADECMDTSGALCFYTDVKYHSTCSTAIVQVHCTAGRTTFCVMLTDGTERCSNLVDLLTASAKEEVSTVIKPFKPATHG